MGKKRVDAQESIFNHDRGEIEICNYCDELILDTAHDCTEDEEEENYSDRLTKGFEMIDPDNEGRD